MAVPTRARCYGNLPPRYHDGNAMYSQSIQPTKKIRFIHFVSVINTYIIVFYNLLVLKRLWTKPGIIREADKRSVLTRES